MKQQKRILLLLLLLLLVFGFQRNVQAAGALSGTVSYPGSGEQIRVFVSRYAGGPGTITYVSVNPDGTFYVGGIDRDTCYAKTWTDNQSSYLVVQYYNLQDLPNDADPIDIIDGEVTTGVDFQLVYGGGFSGTVVNSAGPVSHVSVTLHKEQCNHSRTVTTFSNDAGEFHVRGVPVGTYYMKVTSGGSYWWLAADGSAMKDCLASAPVVEIIPRETTTGIDVVLDLGSVTGIVQNRANGDPLPDIAMWLKPDACSSDGAKLAFTGTDGRYRFSNTATGSYYLQANGGERRYWLDGSPEGTLSCSAASMITVEDGLVTENIDMSIPAPGSVDGTVRDGNSNPLWEKVQVEFYLNPCDANTFMGTAYRHEDGYYRKDGLPEGNVYLYANSWGEEESKWYRNDDAAAADCSDAQPVSVVSGQLTSQVDFILTPPVQEKQALLVPMYLLLLNK